MSETTRPSPENRLRSYYIVGSSRTNADNAITKIYGSFYMAFEVEEDTELVINFSCTHTLQLTESFLGKMFLGQNFPQIDTWLERELEQRYSGSSKKAVLVAYQNALKRYQSIKKDGKSRPTDWPCL